MSTLPINQLELTLETQNLRELRRELQRERQASIARLWFHRMHAVVDRTLPWTSATKVPAEQSFLPLVPMPAPEPPPRLRPMAGA